MMATTDTRTSRENLNSGGASHAGDHGAGMSTLFTGLFQPVDAAFLVYFRVVFGLSMIYWIGKGWYTGLAHIQYVAPRFHFSYYGFEWLQPWLGNGVHLLLGMMAVASLFVVIGYFYRVSALVVAAGFTYLFLLDKSGYQNHYYLISLIGAIMVVMPAHVLWAVDAWQRPAIRSRTVPAWTLWLLRFQVGVPYFYGGLAKITGDWLLGEPMRLALAQKAWFPVLGPFFASEWGVQFFVWGGLLFDLLVVPALMWRPTRFPAFVACVLFHILNATLWPIGVFPWLMILLTAVYFPPDWPSVLLKRSRADVARTTLTWSSTSVWQKLTAAALLLFIAIQVLVPFRHYLNQGNDSWTEEAHCFSWHMMLRAKSCGVRFYATDPRSGRTGTIDLRPYVTELQANRFGRDPRAIHQLARYVARDLRTKGFDDVEIRVLALVSLNGRKPQMMIDPTVDLGSQPVTWAKPAWILPLHEPLREEAWDVPLAEWEQHIALPKHFDLTQAEPAQRNPM